MKRKPLKRSRFFKGNSAQMSASSDLLNGNNVDCEQLSLLLKNN